MDTYTIVGGGGGSLPTITGVIDTGDKLFASVNDSTGDKLY